VLDRGSLPVTLEAPGLARERDFLQAVNVSRRLHRNLVTPPRTSAAFRAFVAANERETRDSHFVVAVDSGALVGVINIEGIARGLFQSATLGYFGFEPHVRRGLMRAGLVLVIRRAFAGLGLHRLESNIQPTNERSIALVRSLGFRLEGFSPRYLKICGRWRDHERWAILREEWSVVRGDVTSPPLREATGGD
jgi:ribosomal-protein-alanine N-acetyltransferase